MKLLQTQMTALHCNLQRTKIFHTAQTMLDQYINTKKGFSVFYILFSLLIRKMSPHFNFVSDFQKFVQETLSNISFCANFWEFKKQSKKNVLFFAIKTENRKQFLK